MVIWPSHLLPREPHTTVSFHDHCYAFPAASAIFLQAILQQRPYHFEASCIIPAWQLTSCLPQCSQMMVEWTTADVTTPVVMYGTTNGSLTMMVSATTKTYNASSMCGSPANSTGYIDPGMLHSALLSNLSYNTRYYYQYGDMVSCSNLP